VLSHLLKFAWDSSRDFKMLKKKSNRNRVAGASNQSQNRVLVPLPFGPMDHQAVLALDFQAKNTVEHFFFSNRMCTFAQFDICSGVRTSEYRT